MIAGPIGASLSAPRWMARVLLAAAVYNLVWGFWVVAFPFSAFRLFGMTPPNYPEIWQCVGMIVGVYGIGYAIASADPARHWPIVLVGFLGKLFGPIGFVQSALTGKLPWKFGVINIFNDLIWWVPFGLILQHAYRLHRATRREISANAVARTSGG